MGSSFSRKLVAAILACGLVGMLGGFIHFKIDESREAVSQESAAMPVEENSLDALGELMAKLQESPNDTETLIAIGRQFYDAQEFSRASAFFNRAAISSPANVQARYWQGVSLYREGKYEASAEAMEGLLKLERQPEALYNLGIMYKYRLNMPEKAKALFEELVEHPNADSTTIVRARKELQPAEESKE